MKRRDLILAGVGFTLTAILGCGDPAPPQVDENVEAKAKLQSLEKLAEALAKDPNGLDAAAALEEYRNHPLDVKKNRAEAQAILDAYNAKVKGKFRGNIAQELQMEMTPLETQLKQGS